MRCERIESIDMSNDENPYRAPEADLRPPRIRTPDAHIALSRARLAGLCLTAGLMVIAALLLDGGRVLRLIMVAALAQCAAILIIMRRDPTQVTQLDLLVLRYGILVFAALVFLIRNTAG